MLNAIRPGTNRLEITPNAKLNAGGTRTALTEPAANSKHIQNGIMLYDVVDSYLPSLDAIAIEFSRFPSMFELLEKFDRAAVLNDKTWLKKVSEFEGACSQDWKSRPLTGIKKLKRKPG